MTTVEMVGAVHAAAVCEIAWLGADGQPDAAAATPLVLDDRPALAFPYAYAELARAIGSARQVSVVLSDARQSGSSWRPIAVHGRPRMVEDADGTLFTERLLRQELRKHPPSRALADSPILQREHWWYLPRLVVTVEPEAVSEMPVRSGGRHDGVVAAAIGGRLQVGGVAIERTAPAALLLAPLTPGLILGPDPAAVPSGTPAVVLCHDFSTPDLERWTSWTAVGTLGGSEASTLLVSAETGTAELPPPPGLLARVRRQRDLARACRRALPD